MADNEGYNVDQITRDDLDKQTEVLKEYYDLKMEPMKKDVNAHGITLYGKTGWGGITAAVVGLMCGFASLSATLYYLIKELKP